MVICKFSALHQSGDLPTSIWQGGGMTDPLPKPVPSGRSHLDDLPEDPLSAEALWDLPDQVLRGWPSAPDMVSANSYEPWYALAGITPVTAAQLTQFKADMNTEIERRVTHRGEPYIEGLDEHCAEIIEYPLHVILDRDPGDDLDYSVDLQGVESWFRQQVLMNLPGPTYMRYLGPNQKSLVQRADSLFLPEAYSVPVSLAKDLGVNFDEGSGEPDIMALIVSPTVSMYTGAEWTAEQAATEAASVAQSMIRPGGPKPRPPAPRPSH